MLVLGFNYELRQEWFSVQNILQTHNPFNVEICLSIQTQIISITAIT